MWAALRGGQLPLWAFQPVRYDVRVARGASGSVAGHCVAKNGALGLGSGRRFGVLSLGFALGPIEAAPLVRRRGRTRRGLPVGGAVVLSASWPAAKQADV